MNITIKTIKKGELSSIYMSDLHFELDNQKEQNLSFFKEKEADIAIIAGDLASGTDGEFFIRHLTNLGYIVIYVLGNHEFWFNDIDDIIQQWRDIAKKIDGFYFLEKDTVTINNVDFIGATLWTSFGTKDISEDIDWFIYQGVKGSKDFEFINKLKPNIWKHLHFQAREYIFGQLNPDRKQVVITHYCPSELSSHDRYRTDTINNSLFFSELGNKIAYSNILFWIHGHTHDSYNYFINNTNVLCNPRGYYDYNMINSNFSWNDYKFKIELD